MNNIAAKFSVIFPGVMTSAPEHDIVSQASSRTTYGALCGKIVFLCVGFT